MPKIRFTVGGDYDRNNSLLAAPSYTDGLVYEVDTFDGYFLIQEYQNGAATYSQITDVSNEFVFQEYDGSFMDFSDNLRSIAIIMASHNDDILIGSWFSDGINGGSGDDRIAAGGGRYDVVYGDDGNDYLIFTATPGLVSGGDGTDTLVVETMNTTRESFVLNNTNTHDIERLIVKGGAFANLAGLSETIPVIRVISDFGTETGIYGTRADDRIVGGNGSDALGGGAGRDIVTGGGGADVFGFLAFTDFGTTKRDRITDFDRSEGDKIALNVLDPDAITPGDQAFAFIGDDAFTGAGGTAFEVRTRDDGSGNYTVFLDIDGNARADFAFIVHSESGPLIASDFLL